MTIEELSSVYFRSKFQDTHLFKGNFEKKDSTVTVDAYDILNSLHVIRT